MQSSVMYLQYWAFNLCAKFHDSTINSYTYFIHSKTVTFKKNIVLRNSAGKVIIVSLKTIYGLEQYLSQPVFDFRAESVRSKDMVLFSTLFYNLNRRLISFLMIISWQFTLGVRQSFISSRNFQCFWRLIFVF